MLIKKSEEIKGSEITDENLYLNRRNFIRGGILAATTAATAMLYRKLAIPGRERPKIDFAKLAGSGNYVTPDGQPATSFEDITHYNNFYEFSTSKGYVAEEAKDFVSRPWTIEVGGLVHKPRRFDLDEIL